MNFFGAIKTKISNCDNFSDPLDVLKCSEINENIKINKDKETNVYIFIIMTTIVPFSVCLFYKLSVLYMRFRERKINRHTYHDEEYPVF